MNVDSLMRIFRNTKLNDTTRLNAIQDIAWETLYIDPEKAIEYSTQQISFAQKKDNKLFVSRAYNTIACANFLLGDYPKSLTYNLKALKLRQQIKDTEGVAASYGNIGTVYEAMADLSMALDYHLKSLKIEEELKNLKGVAQSYVDIGLIYEATAAESSNQQDYKRALNYYNKAITITKNTNNYAILAAALGNAGNVYEANGNHKKALEFQKQSLYYWKKTNALNGLASTYGNLGNIYQNIDDVYLKKVGIANRNEITMQYYDSAFAISSQMQDLKGMGLSKLNVGRIYFILGQKDRAIETVNYALQLFKEIGDMDNEKQVEEVLYDFYKALNDSKKALSHYERYIKLKDLIYKEETQKEITRKELTFEFAKRTSIDSIKRAEERVIVKAKLRHEEVTRYYLYSGMALMVVFALFIFNRFRITKKQKAIIERQKLLVEEKNKEITDSINYAKRLQDAILPPEKFWKKHLPHSFIFYKPKDIVAGDFYWMEVVHEGNNEHIFFASADCTGHGVPGALVSVVCSNALNRAVKEFHLTIPGQILDKVRELVLETFRANADLGDHQASEVKDGMDISFCCLEKNSSSTYSKLTWSGANNPLWIYENNTKTIREIMGDAQPIGFHHKPVSFTTQTIDLQKEDIIFIFTDGFADQFGGPKGKKFKYANLNSLLSQCQNKGFESTLTSLEQKFEEWKGDLEQLDDVCVIGVKI